MRRLPLVTAVAGALTLVGPLMAGAEEAVPLVEAARCAAPSGEAPVATAVPGQTQVSFDVPAMTWVRSDGAVATNTGCAPRSTDAFVAEGRPAAAAEIAHALEVGRHGDWRQVGAWHFF